MLSVIVVVVMGKMGKMEDMGERRMMSITRPLTHLTPPHIVSYGISSTTLREIMRQNNEVEVNPAGNLIIRSFSELPSTVKAGA